MQIEKIYEEKIFSKGITVLLTIATIVFLLALLHQATVGPIGTRPAPNWFLLVMFLLFLGLTVNFSNLSIKMTSR